MKKIYILPAILLLSACKTMPDMANCGNADRVRAAAVKVIETVNRVCPIKGE